MVIALKKAISWPSKTEKFLYWEKKEGKKILKPKKFDDDDDDDNCVDSWLAWLGENEKTREKKVPFDTFLNARTSNFLSTVS